MKPDSRLPSFSLSWIFYAPPALQIIAQVYGSMLYQGALSIVIIYWNTITDRFWNSIADLVDIDISGFDRILDGATLVLLLLVATISSRLRRVHVTSRSITNQNFRSGSWPGLWPIMVSSFFLTTLSHLFAIEYIEYNGIRGSIATFLLSFLFILLFFTAYFGYSRSYVFSENSGFFRRNVLQKLIIILGYATRGGMIGSVIFILALIYNIQFDIGITYDNIHNYATFIILISTSAIFFSKAIFNFPPISSIVDDVEKFAIAVLAFIAVATAFRFFINDVPDFSGDKQIIKNTIWFSIIILMPLSAIICLRTNWSIIPNIIKLAAVALFADQSLAFIKEILAG